MSHVPLHSYIATDRQSVPVIDCLLFFRGQRALIIWTLFVLFIIFLINLLVSPFFVRYTETHLRFVLSVPDADAGALWTMLWDLMNALYAMMLKAGSFYLSFLIAYILAAPLYQFISIMAEDLFRGKTIKEDGVPEVEEVVSDIKQSAILAGMLFGVAIIAIIANFIPFFGPLLCFVLLCFSSALLFFDFPASRAGWDLRQKVEWLIANPFEILRFGLFPTLVTIVPILTPLLMGLVSPLVAIYVTLNFILFEEKRKRDTAGAKTRVIES